MGIVSSKPDDGATLFLRDQNRRSSAQIIGSPMPKNTFQPRLGHQTLTAALQDTEVVTSPGGAPNFILKLTHDEELVFTFTFIIRQGQQFVTSGATDTIANIDTQISGLTYVYASNPREVENLVTREFHADPNLHKNSNVELVGDFGTGGHASVSFEWTWKWKPPKPIEDRGGGWRNSCSFVEYDPRAHRLHTLASFSYWVSNATLPLSHPNSPSPPFLLTAPPKIRVASSQSVDSRISNAELDEPSSPLPVNTSSSTLLPVQPPLAQEPVKVDVACPKPTDDVLVPDDGPVFRATIKALEQKTGNMRTQMKRVLKMAKQAHEAQVEANKNFSEFIDTLREASSTNANAVQPAIEHYFDKIAREILSYERQNTVNLKRIVIDPLDKFYTVDIKQAESKKRDFEEESKDYYAYVSRYLGQRHDSVKAKKLAESDSKYQTKRRNFELKRFDYSSFMQDLHGGRKEQEVLSHLTRYADAQTRTFLEAAKKIDTLVPQLEALSNEVQEADKEYQYQRREREEKRRLLEKGNQTYNEPEPVPLASTSSVQVAGSNGNAYVSDSDLGRADSTGSQLKVALTSGSNSTVAIVSPELSRSPGSLGASSVGSPAQASKFKGIRDLEEKDYGTSSASSAQRKEGLLWSLSKPGNHVDPRNLKQQGWHKFWIVLDQGKLSEYSNWKQRLDLHMDPIDLRMASVREARNAERRFCFEVITPHYKRVYQATSEEDMNSWILAINNALQSAVEGRVARDKSGPGASDSGSIRKDIGSILTGKSPSVGHNSHHAHSNSGAPMRRITVGARPSTHRSTSSSYDDNPDKLLQLLRDNDQGNCWCADCGSGTKVEWVSINLAIIVCIECSGIHRSLGTHISKVRSLTLDINSFTPDIVELLLLVGNRVSNMIWEAKLEPGMKPGPQATREQRLRFITAKYVDRAYIEPISATLSRYPTPEDTLLAAIKKNEIQQVIYALALKASPNVTDRSRGTHAVFLALAAADPASPSPTPGQPSEAERVVPFPVAEMLLQNGAEIPSSMPAFPLSRSAQLYIEEKRGRNTGFSSDTVGTLPGNMSPDQKLARERESRLQKRVSAGGRLAKSPIPER
ncbi:Protein csx2 [Colletotrichum gloeosporioides]|uniref:ADP-ribosylation factor GTPase-activating protein n=2 Tax=Colletotrichum gloeosporioides TaxID=474922 RepID=A0A8H4CG86_COLGL|nr:Protein csx2 [Colletotrichum gloeosporioides]KAF3803428.1 Protein csx2 [Colletotrichum gloeosporioides]